MSGTVKGMMILRVFGALMVLTLVLAGASATPAAYIGPIRASGPDVRDPSGDYIVLNKTGGPGGVSECTLNTHCTTDPSPEQQHYWCGGGPLYADGWCGAHPGSCWTGTVVTRYCHFEPGPDEPPATCSGTANCGMPGANGWCRGGASVSFSANDPLGGYLITAIEGNQGGGDYLLCDPADGKNINCTWSSVGDGLRTLNYWAHSTKGDTSAMGSLGLQVDATYPSASISLNQTPNAAGWIRNNVTVTTHGTDATSGVAGRWVQVNGGPQQASPMTLSANGIYAVNGVVRDNAGNETVTGVTTVRLDTMGPTITVSPDRAPESGMWYMGPVTVGVIGADNLSGYSHTNYVLTTGTGSTLNGSMPVTISTEGVNNLNMSAFDVAENSRGYVYTYRIDLSEPTAEVEINGSLGDNDWYVSPVSLTVDATDTGSGVCSRSVNVDSAGWEAAPILSYTTQGQHVVVGQSADCVGQLSPVTADLLFKLDSVAPGLTLNIPPSDGKNNWHITPFIVGVIGSDATSGVGREQVQVNYDPWVDHSALVRSEGLVSLGARVRDHAGNESSHSVILRVDLSDPVLKLSEVGTSGLNGWYVGPVVVDVTAMDAVSGLGEVQVRLNGSAWANNTTLTLGMDGVHQVDARAEDNAGRERGEVAEIRIDQTLPVINPTIEGTLGKNGWYVSPVTLRANAEDTTSGIASVLPAEALVVNDTTNYVPEWIAQDHAGNEAHVTLGAIKVDTTKPAIGFDPLEEVLIGVATLTGRAHDGQSGLEKVEISVNGGLTWTEVIINPDGTWGAPFNTLLFPGGDRLVLARAEDRAGNINTVDLSAVIANKGPAIDLTDRWYVWESGDLHIEAGDNAFETVTVEVCDYETRWPCEVWIYKDQVPEKVTWDRYFGSVYAPVGEYRVRAMIVDRFGRSDSEVGVIVIPPKMTPPATPTLPPTLTATRMATKIGTQEPTLVAKTPAATATILPVLTATPIGTIPVSSSNNPRKPFNFGPYLVLIGFCFALGASVSRDRRPHAWRRLAEQLSKMNHIQKSRGDKKE